MGATTTHEVCYLAGYHDAKKGRDGKGEGRDDEHDDMAGVDSAHRETLPREDDGEGHEKPDDHEDREGRGARQVGPA